MRVLLKKILDFLLEEYKEPELNYVLTVEELPTEGDIIVFRCDHYTEGLYKHGKWYVVEACAYGGFDKYECSPPSAWSYQ